MKWFFLAVQLLPIDVPNATGQNWAAGVINIQYPSGEPGLIRLNALRLRTLAARRLRS